MGAYSVDEVLAAKLGGLAASSYILLCNLTVHNRQSLVENNLLSDKHVRIFSLFPFVDFLPPV